MMSSVTKVVQPTATVISKPVSGPSTYKMLNNNDGCLTQQIPISTATGIARSIPAGQSMRQQPQYPTPITSSNTSNDSTNAHAFTTNKVRINQRKLNLQIQTVLLKFCHFYWFSGDGKCSRTASCAFIKQSNWSHSGC